MYKKPDIYETSSKVAFIFFPANNLFLGFSFDGIPIILCRKLMNVTFFSDVDNVFECKYKKRKCPVRYSFKIAIIDGGIIVFLAGITFTFAEKIIFLKSN